MVSLQSFCASFPDLIASSDQQLSSLQDSKTSVESTALKNIALEYLGTIGARICQDSNAIAGPQRLQSLPDIVNSCDKPAFAALTAAQQCVLRHLSRNEKAEGSSEVRHPAPHVLRND